MRTLIHNESDLVAYLGGPAGEAGCLEANLAKRLGFPVAAHVCRHLLHLREKNTAPGFVPYHIDLELPATAEGVEAALGELIDNNRDATERERESGCVAELLGELLGWRRRHGGFDANVWRRVEKMASKLLTGGPVALVPPAQTEGRTDGSG